MIRSSLLAAVVAIFSLETAYADPIRVSLDTSSLVGHPAGPFSLLFVLVDGAGVGTGDNLAIISHIDLGGGSFIGTPVSFGSAAGSPTTAILLDDSFPLAISIAQFAPGLELTFLLTLSSADDLTGTPDRFTFSLLDSAGIPIPTRVDAGDYLLGADFTSSGPAFDLWPTDSSRPPSLGDPIVLAAPAIASVSQVPEPASFGLMAGAIALLTLGQRRLGRR